MYSGMHRYGIHRRSWDATMSKLKAVMINDQSSPERRWVTQANEIIEAACSLTIDAKRLLLIALSKLPYSVDEEITDATYKHCDVTVREWAEAFGIGIDGAYARLKSAAHDLKYAPLLLRPPKALKSRNKREDFERATSWVSTCDYYKDNQSQVRLHFSGQILRYILNLDDEFTWYRLQSVLSLRTMYAVNLLELCAQWRRQGVSKLYPLHSLREHLGVGDSYGRWADLKRYVIEKSVKEISELSELTIKYEVKKTAQQVTHIQFYIKTKNQADMFSNKVTRLPLPPQKLRESM